MTKEKRKFTPQDRLILILLATSIGCDQISKNIVRQRIEFNSNIRVLADFVTLTRAENTGAFLSMGHNLPRIAYIILMIAIPLIVLGYGLYYLLTRDLHSKLFIIGSCLIIGGGFGNLIDRILYGSVTDFMHFNFILFQTGIVNLSDISITAGFFIFVYKLYFSQLRLNS
jgi:signal peptidase II